MASLSALDDGNKKVEDEINFNFLYELDSTYLFNTKRDLMKNIFSLYFIDTIFYDKNFIELKKLFFQTYGHSIEQFSNRNFSSLNYPTRIKNFSNGLEPSLFLKPFNDFYSHKTFPITHEYFENYLNKNKIKFKSGYINLIGKQISIPIKEKTCSYKCELIKINRAIYGNIIYSKSGKYLYFEQKDFEEVYNNNNRSMYFLGMLSLSAVKMREKE